MLSNPVIIAVITGVAGIMSIYANKEDITSIFDLSKFKCNTDTTDNTIKSPDGSVVNEEEWVIINEGFQPTDNK